MMTRKIITIDNMVIKNFKGCVSRKIDFNNSNTLISGGNATGKSTIFEAYLWCLFGKNSKGEVLNIQPRDENGDIIHKIISSVSTKLSIIEIPQHGNKEEYSINIKRELSEKWSVPRGTNVEVYGGTETKYIINEIPMPMKDFNQKLSDIIDLNTWLMLSDINSFFRLKTEDRRKVLVKTLKDLSEEEIAQPYPIVLQALKERKSIPELKAQVVSQKREANKRKDEIPIEINAKYELLVNDIDFDEVDVKLKALTEKIEQIDREISSGISNGHAEKIKSKLNEYNEAMRDLEIQKAKINSDIISSKHKAEQKILEIKNNLEKLQLEETQLQTKYQFHSEEIKNLLDKKENLRQNWIKINDSVYSGNTICSECSREYTDEYLANIIENFNIEKIKKLDDLTKQAEEIQPKIDKLIADNNTINLLIDDKNSFIQKTLTDLDNANNTLNTLKSLDETLLENANYQSQLGITNSLFKDYQNLIKEEEEKKSNNLSVNKHELTQERDELVKLMAKKSFNENIQRDIVNLEQQAKNTALIICDLDNSENQINSFIKDKINRVEESVSSLFKIVRFKMYEQNKTNDGEKPICEAYTEGVPYSETNDAMTMSIGLDVIQGLSNYYNVSLPLFVDRFESLETIKSENQIITLEVVKNLSELTIKTL